MRYEYVLTCVCQTRQSNERYITPTMDDILCDLNGATVFSKLDLNNRYHQLELDPAS